MDAGYLEFLDHLELYSEPLGAMPACGVPTAVPKAFVMLDGRPLTPVLLNSRQVFHFRLHAYGSGLGADSCNYVLFGVIRNKQVKNFARNISPCDSYYDQLPSRPIACSDLHLVSRVSLDFAMFGEIERPRKKTLSW